MRVVAIIQARMNSMRLLGKVLLPLPQDSGVPVLARIIRRLKKCKTLNEIVVATCDFKITEIAQKEGTRWYLGDEEDVLGRYFLAADIFKADVIVRITGDCPCVDPEIVDRVVRTHLAEGKDCTFNRNDNVALCSQIDGLDVEVFSFDALKKAHENALIDYEREHVTAHFYAHPEEFKILQIESGWYIDKDVKLSIDTAEDYEEVCRLYKALGPDFSTRDIQKYYEGEKDVKR